MKKNGFVEFIKSPVGKIVLIFVLYVLIFAIEYALISYNGKSTGLAIVLLLFLAIFGWKALDKITPDLFLIMPLGHWLLYWLIKGFLAILVGTFVAPFQISKMIISKIE